MAPFLEVPSLDRNESLVTGSTAALDTAAEEALVETLEPWVLVASPFEWADAVLSRPAVVAGLVDGSLESAVEEAAEEEEVAESVLVESGEEAVPFSV